MKIQTVACLFSTPDYYTLRLIEGVISYVSRSPHLRIRLPSRIPFHPFTSRDDFHGDGVIGFFTSPESVLDFTRRGIVAVNVSSAIDLVRPWVHVDNQRVGSLAADGLCSHGLRRFLYVDFSDMLQEGIEKSAEAHFSLERFVGFQRQLRTRGLETARWRLSLQAFCQPLRWASAMRRMIRKLQALPKPMGVYCVNDYAAGLVLRACQEAGLRVPEEIAVIGTDNDSLICNGLDPRLSSIELGPERLGQAAAKLLDDILAGRETRQAEVCLDPVELVERESLTSRLVEDPLIAEAMRLLRLEMMEGQHLIASLPGRLGMSRRAFERRFKMAVALSPAQELMRLRLQKVKQELLCSQRSVKEIAFDCGFCGAEHLHKRFRQCFGISPDAWRKQNRVPVRCPRLPLKNPDKTK